MKTPPAATTSEDFARLAETLERNSMADVMEGLADFFAVDGLGLTGANASDPEASYVRAHGPTPAQPWKSDAGLRNRLSVSLVAQKHEDRAGEWLISEVWQPGASTPCYFWGVRTGKRGWRPLDAWVWQLAGQAVARRCFPPIVDGVPTAEMRHRLDQAAAVTGRLAHDFGNYLTGALGFTELSIAHLAPDHAAQVFLREVLQSTKQGAEWVHRLHLFCKRGASPVWPVQLASVVAEEENRIRAANLRGLQLEVDLASDLPLVSLDGESVATALAELVRNAREATRDEGTIRVAARVVELSAADCAGLIGAAAPGLFIEMTVADNGPGISAECRAKLFQEMFFSTKPKHRGLGFLVLYGIVQRSRGGMRIGVAAKGKGTQVQLFLPVATIDALPRSGRQLPELLLVQTDAVQSESMRLILESAGCRVEMASSFPQAFSICVAAKKEYDLIVAQSQFPQGSGFDLARRILDREPNANFVFVLTQPFFQGLIDEEMVNRFPLVRWPTDLRSFLAAVQTGLEKGRLAKAGKE